MAVLGPKMKLTMVICMLATVVFIIFYAWKKIRKRHKQMIRDSQEVERHAKVAILEEQQAAAQGPSRPNDTETTGDEKAESVALEDLCQSYDYELLWNQFAWDLLSSTPRESEPLDQKPSTQPAQIEVLLYHQSLVKVFKVIIIGVENIEQLGLTKDDHLRLKAIICQADGTQLTEKSAMYPCAEKCSETNKLSINERFTFHMSVKDFSGAVLYISSWRIDVFHRESLLGAISLDLSLQDFSTKSMVVEELIPVRKDRQISGFLLLSLCHDPEHERLICVILRAKELRDWARAGSSVLNNVINPFIKIKLVCHGKIIKKHRTNCIFESTAPLFNEMIQYYVPEDQIKFADLFIQIVHRDRSTDTNHPIGRLTIGCHGDGTANDHWKHAMLQRGQSIARWHAVFK